MKYNKDGTKLIYHDKKGGENALENIIHHL
jgi:hypothetical protein